MPQLHKMQLCFHILAIALKVLDVVWVHWNSSICLVTFFSYDHGWIHSNPMGRFYYIEYLFILNPHAAYISVSKFKLVYFSFFFHSWKQNPPLPFLGAVKMFFLPLLFSLWEEKKEQHVKLLILNKNSDTIILINNMIHQTSKHIG